jgi:glycosyltransferase involved in cell wall biosynthesis
VTSLKGKRILVLSQYYAPEPGAPPIRLGAMTRELKKLGVDVAVVTGMPNYPKGVIFDAYRGKLTMREEVEGVSVRRVWLYPASGRGAIKRLANYLSFTATAAVALVAEGGVDLVFVEAQPITLAVPALLNQLLRGVPYVYNTPDLQVEYAAEDRWVGVRALVGAAKVLEQQLMKRALSVTTVTHAFIEHFVKERDLPLSHFTFLPNGADTERLYPSPRDAELALKLGVGDRKVFTFAGTHAPYQGIEVILEAAALLRDRSDIVFLMVGEGPMRQPLIDRARAEGLENVLFRSSPFHEMRALMSLTTASLVVLRPLGISKMMRLSKAVPPLACGVPIIYAGWGETASIVQREQVGFTVEPGDARRLADAVLTLADNPARRDELGRRGRALVEREMSWAFIVRDWVRQIERVIDGKEPDVPGLRQFLDQQSKAAE